MLLDAKGDCKVGDFGLATSSLAAVDPSDVTRPTVYQEADLTLGAFLFAFFVFVFSAEYCLLGCRGWNKVVYCSRGPVKEKRTKES